MSTNTGKIGSSGSEKKTVAIDDVLAHSKIIKQPHPLSSGTYYVQYRIVLCIVS